MWFLQTITHTRTLPQENDTDLALALEMSAVAQQGFTPRTRMAKVNVTAYSCNPPYGESLLQL